MSGGGNTRKENKRSSGSGSGTYTDVGRHSNEWLFAGFSLRETVKETVGKLKGGEAGGAGETGARSPKI